MKRLLLALSLTSGLLLVLPQCAAAAASPEFGTIQNFGPSLVSDCPLPEGIAVDPETGNVYTTGGTGTAVASICVLSPAGRLIDRIPVAARPGGTVFLLGELFVPGEGLYVLDNDDTVDATSTSGRLLKVDPSTHAVTTIASGFAFPNGLARDHAGNLFVSDSFKGTIFRVGRQGSVTVWSHDPLLAPHGFVGVNDLAFDRGQRFLYTDNSDNMQLLRIPVRDDGSAGPGQIFVNGLEGLPDGVQFDVRGNLYVCMPSINQVQVFSPTGQVLTRLIGTGANAMDFPASLVFKGRTLYISDFSILDGGVNSKVSSVQVPFPGLPLAGEEEPSS